MSQRLAAKAAPLPDKKSANIDKIIGLSNSCAHLKSIKNIFRNILPRKILPVSLQNENPFVRGLQRIFVTFGQMVQRQKVFLNMRLVIQRVKKASVSIDGEEVSAIGKGLLVLVGVENGDTEEDMRWLAGKTVGLRIFDDEEGVMNRSVMDIGGDILAVSQFTLTASTRKGNRPSYIRAAGHDLAVSLYEKYCETLSAALGKEVGRGVFGADMQVSLINDGPVTIIIDSGLKE